MHLGTSSNTSARSRLSAAHTVARTAATAAAAALALTSLAITGCGEEPPPPPPPPVKAPPPPPPPKPTVTPISQLMKELGISDKIRLPEDKAPTTEHERVAVLKFFDAFAKNQPDNLKGALSEQDLLVLEGMAKAGALASVLNGVERIDLATSSVGGKPYVMAVFRSGGAFQPQLWEFTVDGEGRKVNKQVFESYVQPVDVLSKISGSDLIPEWIKLVAAERRLADEPDEIIKPPQRVAKAEAEESEAAGGGGPVGAPPMRRKPPSDPIKPPDFKPGGN